MPEEVVGQVEEVVSESPEGTEGVSETTDEAVEETVDVSTLDTDLEKVNLDVLKERFAEHPELFSFARQLQGDYTRKTQYLAAERRAMDAVKKQMEEQFNNLRMKSTPGADIDFDTATPKQIASWLQNSMLSQVQNLLDQRVNPLQNEVQVAKMNTVISDIETRNPLFKDPEVQNKVVEYGSQLGNAGMRAEVVFKAAAFDALDKKYNKLVGSQTKKKATAIKQTTGGSTDVATTGTLPKTMNEALEIARRNVREGKW